tara:strand:+ start:887 stop:1252 length:366 start_codon:yes stop_codon:yes gene_type:complete
MILKDTFGVEYQLAVINAFVDNTNTKTNTKINSQLVLTPVDGSYPTSGYLELYDPGNTEGNNQTIGGIPVQDEILSVKDYVGVLEQKSVTLEQKVYFLENKIFELGKKINTILRMDEITKI